MTPMLVTYRRTGSSLHAARAWVAAAYVASLCSIAVFYEHPLILAAALLGLGGAGVAAGVVAELARALKLAAPLALLVALVNPLVSREGLTVLARGPEMPVLGRLDITLEAVAYGGVAAMRVLVLVGAFALYSAAVNPDEMLRLFRRLSFRSALTVSLATRLVPVLGHDAQRLGDAYALRASQPGQSEGRLGRTRRAAVLGRALAGGALERAVDLAAALEVRGYAAAPRRQQGAGYRTPWSRHDVVFAAAALTIALMGIAGWLTGLARFTPYPLLRVELGPADLALAVAIVATTTAPFWSARRRRRAFDA